MQGTSSTGETRKSNGSFGSTPEQVFANSTPNNSAALQGSINVPVDEKKSVGIDPASPAQLTTKAQYVKSVFFGSPLRTGLTFAAAALIATLSKTAADCANGDCTMSAEELQKMFHMANATLTTAAKAGITAGVNLVAPAATGVTFATMHVVASNVRGLFGSKKPMENSAPESVVSANVDRREETPLLS